MKYEIVILDYTILYVYLRVKIKQKRVISKTLW